MGDLRGEVCRNTGGPSGWRAGRRRVLPLAALAALGSALAAGPAAAIEFFEGRLQVHGYYELQLRSIARDWSASDDWDVTQLAHVLNVEVEADLIQDRFGPVDLMSAFGRIEVRYDCIWTHGCGLFQSIDAWGNGAQHLPKRLNDGRRAGFVGTVPDYDIRHYRGEPPTAFRLASRDLPRGSRRPYGIESTDAFGTLFTSSGADGVLGTPDDPGPFYFDLYFDADDNRCKFSSRKTAGPIDGVGVQNLGPLDPTCRPVAIAAFADKPNPFRAGDINPLTGGGGSFALPYRPATEVNYLAETPDSVARGLWIPNEELRRLLEEGDLEELPHFSQNDLSWNHGLSQDEEQELKELYLDVELFDSRLWLRLGKQTIVWGKTELFRNQDQFNPQDLALSSLPSLEESRTALWAARAIWSFYNVGPLEDLRLELAVNYDQFEPSDLGQCGEPYSVVLLCAGAFGVMAHGFEGLGIAGVVLPPDAWESWKGIEVGARVEFRWDRFSFSISDFYGYADFPTIEKIFTYSRNVDPETGRPRRAGSTGRCRTGSEADCLGPGTDALLHHYANQTLFTKNCSATFGFLPDLDPAACGLSIFNSTARTLLPEDIDPGDPLGPIKLAFAPRLMIALTNVLSGQSSTAFPFHGAQVFEGLGMMNLNTVAELNRFPWVHRYISQELPGIQPTPLVPLSRDPNDGPVGGSALTPAESAEFGSTVTTWQVGGIEPYLTDEQEALLGCGPFFGTRCDVDGIDLLNMEASAVFQSFVGFDGTFGDWDTTNRRVDQPGTVGFQGGPVCTRYERGRMFILPGCRGPRDPGYDPRVDGSVSGPKLFAPGGFIAAGPRVHPFTGQRFDSEMAVVSWNLMMALVGFSMPDDPNNPLVDEFDPDRPFRTNGCSMAKPQFCKNFNDFWRSIATTRNVVQAGGNSRFGRRDFIWHHGTPILVRFDKTNILGASVDFAEDRTKSNWSIEATWVDDVFFGDADEFSGLSEVDTYNVTLSVDRPTFVNFLNANRTFFFNAQVFVQYIDGYVQSFSSNGPWNTLLTFTVTTGYWQDRLLPSATFVWDLRSDSGAFLPQVTYRFTENFSASVGAAIFAGRFQAKTMAINPIASRNRAGEDAYVDHVENGLSVIRDRDELFLRLRYTF